MPFNQRGGGLAGERGAGNAEKEEKTSKRKDWVNSFAEVSTERKVRKPLGARNSHFREGAKRGVSTQGFKEPVAQERKKNAEGKKETSASSHALSLLEKP